MIERRIVYDFFTALGDVGGLYEIMVIFFTIICQFFFAERFFTLSKVQTLFKYYDKSAHADKSSNKLIDKAKTSIEAQDTK